MGSAQRLLGVPTGTERLQLDRSARQVRTARVIEATFETWGYTPAATPLVDYADAYRPLLSDREAREAYRAVDRTGESVIVRPDTTLFLAKQLGVHLDESELPVRVYYNEQIVNSEDEYDIARNEYRQLGVELVGVTGTDGDAEALLLAVESLVAAGSTHVALHVGSRHVVQSIAARSGVKDEATFVDEVRWRSISGERGLSQAERNLLSYMGDPAQLPSDILTSLDDNVRTAVSELNRTLALVRHEIDGLDVEVVLDLSEVGGHDYYSGLAFGCYVPGANIAVARGGRYDRLLAQFGFDAPSVGFSIYVGKIPAGPGTKPARETASAHGPTFSERLANARARRARGEKVRL